MSQFTHLNPACVAPGNGYTHVVTGPRRSYHEGAGTLEHLGDSYAQTDPAQAERHYRTLLTDHPSLNGRSHTVEISLAELLIAKGEHAEALALLNSWIERDTAQFPNVLFRWHLALILIAEAQGEQETVQRAARTALDLASRGPAFPRHKDVGVVSADRKTLERLERLAR
jgi:hypothetical protein